VGWLLFKKNVNRSWLREIKSSSSQSGQKGFGKDPNQKCTFKIVDRSLSGKNFKAQSETAQNLIEDVVTKFKLNL